MLASLELTQDTTLRCLINVPFPLVILRFNPVTGPYTDPHLLIL